MSVELKLDFEYGIQGGINSTVLGPIALSFGLIVAPSKNLPLYLCFYAFIFS